MKTKAEWAAGKAAELRRQADEQARVEIPAGDWRGVRRKMDGVAALRQEAARFDTIAARLRARAA